MNDIDKIYDLVKNFLEKNSKKIWMSGLGVLGILVLYLILSPIIGHLTKPALINIYILPKAAVIKINGEEYRNGVYEFQPGEYSGEISAEGFQAKKVDFSVKAHEATKVSDYLLCENEAFECYKDMPEVIEEMKAQAASQEEYEFARDYLEEKRKFESDSIAIFTPYESFEQGFKVELRESKYQEGAKHELVVDLKTCIESRVKGLRENFLAWLKSYGLEAENYKIDYWYCNGSKKG